MIVIKDKGQIGWQIYVIAVFLFICESQTFSMFVMLQSTITYTRHHYSLSCGSCFQGHFEGNEHPLMLKGDFPAQNNGYAVVMSEQ